MFRNSVVQFSKTKLVAPQNLSSWLRPSYFTTKKTFCQYLFQIIFGFFRFFSSGHWLFRSFAVCSSVRCLHSIPKDFGFVKHFFDFCGKFLCFIKIPRRKCMMLLEENLKTPLSASIAFERSNAYGLSPIPYNKQKEETDRFIAEKFPLFCWFNEIVA